MNHKTKLKKVKTSLKAGAMVGLLGIASPAKADTLLTATIGGFSSNYPGFAASNLFDTPNPTLGEGNTRYGAYPLGNEFAGNGLNDSDYNPVVKFELDSSVSLSGIDFAQRADTVASGGMQDAVTAIDLYFVSSTTYAGFTPTAGSTPADLTLSLGSPSEIVTPTTSSTAFTNYTFTGGPANAEYVIAQFVDGNTTSNPGGAELRFVEATTPEPSTIALLGLGLAALIATVRGRRSFPA